MLNSCSRYGFANARTGKVFLLIFKRAMFHHELTPWLKRVKIFPREKQIDKDNIYKDLKCFHKKKYMATSCTFFQSTYISYPSTILVSSKLQAPHWPESSLKWMYTNSHSEVERDTLGTTRFVGFVCTSSEALWKFSSCPWSSVWYRASSTDINIYVWKLLYKHPK